MADIDFSKIDQGNCLGDDLQYEKQNMNKEEMQTNKQTNKKNK
jgi:hypothetical protein